MLSPQVRSAHAQSPISAWLFQGKYLPWLVLAIFTAGSFFVWRTVGSTTEREMREQFETRGRETMIRIQQRMKTYEQVLHGLQGLFVSNGSAVTRAQFHEYYRTLRLETNYPGIQGVGFSLLVSARDKDRHVRAVRQEFDPAYEIKPEGPRDVYSTVLYLEPLTERNRRAIGYDMFSEPVRHAAMTLSADSGRAAITPKLRLRQETGEDLQAGFLMYLPVYHSNASMPAGSDDQPHLSGWVYAAFRMNDLMEGLFGEASPEFSLQIFDSTSDDPETMMYDSEKDSSSRADARFRSVRMIDIAGRPWSIVIATTPQFDRGFDTQKPARMGITALIFSILLSLLTWLLVRSRARALDVVRIESRYRNMMEQANDAILVVDMKRRITDANAQAVRHFGYSLDELCTMCIEQLHPPEFAPKVIAQFETVRTIGSARFEAMNLRKDGTHVADEISERIVRVGGEEYVLKFVRDISERKRAEHEREELVKELQTALAEVKTLSGLIPICSSCKKIRDDKGYWNVLEAYLIEHSDAQFTHGVCPDCMKKLYPDYVHKVEMKK